MIDINGASLVADRSGALWWPEERLLAVAICTLKKALRLRARAIAAPYDSRATLSRLYLAITRFEPKTIVCLGDNFHDPAGPDRLDAESRG